MEDIGVLNQILSGDCQIIPLSYTSQFGFVFNMIHPNNTEILKIYILVSSDKSSEGQEFELPNYVDVKLAKELEGKEIDPFDDPPGHVKRMETISNFIKEATIQNDVYNASINNGPLCPEIYGSYILDNTPATSFLKLLKTKCQEKSEGENMIQYLQDNINNYYLGIIRMESAEGYTTFREAPENKLLEEKIQLTKLKNKLPTEEIQKLTEEIQKLTEKIQLLIEKNQPFYENVIYANIRLLMETGYMHLDLNPGNVMLRGYDVLLIDFGKSKSIADIKKHHFTNISKIIEKKPLEPDDIKSMISFINRFDAIENVSSLFQQNFVSRLSNHEGSYQNIRNKLNERENKTVLPKYGQLQQILQNTAVSSNSPQTNHVFGFIGSESPSSPESNKRSPLFVSESSVKRRGLSRDSNSENINPNIFSFYATPRTPRGGAKKSKKTKRKPLHNKRTSKKRQNKKRVKLISNK